MANPTNPGRGQPETSRFGHLEQKGGTESGTLGAVQEKAQEFASTVGEKAQDAWETTRRAATAVADTAGDTWDEMSGFMRRYPAACFFAGVGFGFLLAAAWGSFSSSPSMIRGMERAGQEPRRGYGA